MQPQLETVMYSVSQAFLFPALGLTALLFLYACYALGGFVAALLHRRNGRARPLLEWWLENRGANAEELDLKAHKLLETARIATRVAPMMGLVATMIPMGPALKSLADGNLSQVSENLTIAFSAVILALISASITFWIVNVRRRWLAEELLEIESRRGEVL